MARPVAALQFPGLPNGSRAFIAPHQSVEMKFYPLGSVIAQDGFVDYRDAGQKTISSDTVDAPLSLINFQWNKSMGQPSGTWEAIFKPKSGFRSDKVAVAAGFSTALQDFVIDGDWVDISIIRNGVAIPLCRGVVDTWRETTQSRGGAKVTLWKMTGRDHGAFFEYPITWTNLWVQTLGELAKGIFTERVKGKIGGRPDEMFKILLEATFASGKTSGQWRLPPSLEDSTGVDGGLWKLLKAVTFNASQAGLPGLRGAYYSEPQLWTTGKQNLHQTLAQWCNPLLNEIWYDILPPTMFVPKHGLNGFLTSQVVEQGKLPSAAELAFTEDGIGVGVGTTVTQSLAGEGQKFGTLGAFIRERPFFNTVEGRSGSMWPNLPTWYLPTWLIQTASLGRSGAERYNLFELLGDVGFVNSVEQAAQAKPVWHKQDIEAHGLRVMSQTTRFLAQFRKGIGDWLGTERVTWQKLLVDWYGSAPYLRTGQVVPKVMLPEVRIGQRLILDPGDPKSREQLYVEGVQLDWAAPTATAGASGSTTFATTHGFTGSDDNYFKAIKAHSALFKETF